MIGERTCRTCGKTLPLSEFYSNGHGGRKPSCKECCNRKRVEWRRKRGDRLEAETGKRTLEKELALNNLRLALKRERQKAETGKCYLSEKEKLRQREASRKYDREHKGDPKVLEKKSKYGRNYRQRRAIREEVEILSEFFNNDFEL